MTELHIRLLRRAARDARRRVVAARRKDSAGTAGLSRLADLERARDLAEVRLSAAQARRNRRPADRPPASPPATKPTSSRPPTDKPAARTDTGGGRTPPVAELKALADHATQRLALYRRRMYLGRGEPARLAELERIAAGATARLKRAVARGTDGRTG